jgi:hypothetical protein
MVIDNGRSPAATLVYFLPVLVIQTRQRNEEWDTYKTLVMVPSLLRHSVSLQLSYSVAGVSI